MATIVLTVAGYVVGGYFGAPGIGAWIGSQVGGYIDRTWLFPQDPTRVEGPRLEDLHVQISSYGTPIYKLWGTLRLAGNVIWAAPIREVRTEEEQGGGGCGGGPTIVQVTYAYFGTFAIGICEGPIDRILRIWADTKLIWDVREENTEVVQIEGLNFRVYVGDDEQVPDSWIESFEGEGNVPAHRGLCYVVFDDFPLEKFGNRMPNFTFEVVKDATETVPYDPLPEALSTIWGSDNIVFCPDEVHFVIQANGYWFKLNTISNTVVASAVHLRQENPPLPEYPDLSDYDIDERGRIHTTVYDATSNYSRVTQLTEFFDPSGLASDLVWSPWRVRVFRTARFPFVVCIDSGGTGCRITHRDLYILGNGATWIDVAPPTDVNFTGMDLDEETGTIWTVCKDWINVDDYTKVMRIVPSELGFATTTTWDITSDITYGKEIIYDPDTNQVIVGSSTSNKVVFYDADDMTKLGEITDNECIGAWSKSAWRRGVINGYIHYAYVLNEIYRIDVVSRTIDRQWLCWPHPGNWFGGSCYDPLTHSVIVACQGSGFDYCKVYLDRASPNPVELSTIVESICESVGLDASDDLDTSELTDLVWGYAVNDRMRARAAILPLMDAYFFDGVESDGLLKFPKRGKSSVVTVPEGDLATHLDGEQRPQELTTTRQQELELPLSLDVAYIDYSADYMAGVQREARQITESKQMATLRLPIALSCDEAKQICVKHLGNFWTQRNRHLATIPRGYSYLDPADVITVEEGSATHTLRIEEINYGGGVLALKLVNEDASVYESDAEGTEITGPGAEVAWPGPTTLVLIDCPLLLSTNNEPGMYVATMGITDQWTGAIVFKSSDGEATWQQWTATTKDAMIGRTTDALGDVADPWVWDEGNSVNLWLLDSADSLSSATEAQVLDGANHAIVGDEVIGFKTATQEDDGSWTLSGLLRGRKGTEWATGTHAVGDSFVLLDEDRVHFVPFPVEEMDEVRHYRVVSMGMRWVTGANQEFTCEIRNMMPLSPQHVNGSRDDSDNLTIGWTRRTRYGGEWMDEYGPPLGETTEAYEVDVLDGSTVVRTISATSESASYTAAQQTSDGLTPGDPVDVVVYQISSVVGRGFGTEATV